MTGFDAAAAIAAAEAAVAAGQTSITLDRLRPLIRTRTELDDMPNPEPLIVDTLDRNTLALLAGPWGTCKTFLAVSLACSVATGVPWFGRTVATPGPVLYVATEGVYGLRRRIAAWENEHAASADRLVPVDFLPVPVDLAGRRRGNADVDELVGIVTDRRYELVVVDTLARCLLGADENSARDRGEAVDALDRLRRAAECCVLPVHHMGKPNVNGARTVRGSSALEAAADTVYTVAGDPLLLTLERSKRKDGPTPDRLSLRLREASESAVLEIISNDHVGLTGESHLSQVMRDHFGAAGATTGVLRDVAELPKTTFYRALKSLVAQGIVVNRSTERRPHYFLAPPTLDGEQ